MKLQAITDLMMLLCLKVRCYQFILTFSIAIYTTPLSGDVTHQRVNSAAIYEAIAVVTNVRQRRADSVTRRGV